MEMQRQRGFTLYELMITLLVAVVNTMSLRTNIIQGLVHLVLFAAYIVLIFD